MDYNIWISRVLSLLIPLLCIAQASAQAGPEIDVLVPAAWPAGIAGRPNGATPVAPDFVGLATLAPASRVRLFVAPGQTLQGVVDRIERRSASQFSVFGQLDVGLS